MTAEFRALALHVVAERIAYEHAALVDNYVGCRHNPADLRRGGVAPETSDGHFEPLPVDCAGRVVAERWMRAIREAGA